MAQPTDQKKCPNWIFSVCAFMGFLMCAIPLSWHLKAWNVGTFVLMIWLSIACLEQFINSIIWNGNVVNRAPVWCDIATKLHLAMNVSVPTCTLCINRRLYLITSGKVAFFTKAEKRRNLILDLVIAVGIPVLQMILHYITQGHRFNIFEDLGCMPHIYNTWVALVIVTIPPIVIGIVSGVLGVLNIVAFYKIRAQLEEMLSSHDGMTPHHYFRLMFFSAYEIIGTITVGTVFLYYCIGPGGIALAPWISWADTHFNFSRVGLYPSSLWRAQAPSMEIYRWVIIACAFGTFCFFGLTAEARRNYQSAYRYIAHQVSRFIGRLGPYGHSNAAPGANDRGGLPALQFVAREAVRQPNSTIATFASGQVSHVSSLAVPNPGPTSSFRIASPEPADVAQVEL